MLKDYLLIKGDIMYIVGIILSLSAKGIAQMIITEDSDLVPFGCERVFFKMDKVGNGVLIDKKDLGETLPNGFTHDRFRWMCILSG